MTILSDHANDVAEPEKARFHEIKAKKLIVAMKYYLRDKNV